MITIISCAKTMRSNFSKLERLLEGYSQYFTTPVFRQQAEDIARQLSTFSALQLSKELKVNDNIAQKVYLNYQHFGRGENSVAPAIFAYNGIVFKSLAPELLLPQQLDYCNKHLLITSFLYGLLSPLDIIEPYRLEGAIKPFADQTLFDFWKDKATTYLISRVKESGGVLCNLASGEMQHLFHWKRVCSEVKVVSPVFFEIKEGKRKNIVVYTKIARGLMSRYIVENCVENSTQLTKFNLQGYNFAEEVNGELIFERKFKGTSKD